MTTLRCPICEQPFEIEHSTAMPFCGERCQRIDLGRWLDEGYGLTRESPYADGDEDAEA